MYGARLSGLPAVLVSVQRPGAECGGLSVLAVLISPPSRNGRYRCIACDPPTPEHGGGGRGAQHHYRTERWEDVPRVISLAPCWSPAADCHLYLWATRTSLPHAMQWIPLLGFQYVGWVVWKKEHPGLGQYARGRTELILFAVRGDGYAVRTARRDLEDWVEASQRDYIETGHRKRLRHSQKPQTAYEWMTLRSKGPRLDMFGREPRPGWKSWGDQAVDSEADRELGFFNDDG